MSLSEYFQNLSEKMGKLTNELEILSASMRSGATTDEAMENLVESNQNELRTKSNTYKDIETAEEVESDAVKSYLHQRLKQTFGEE